jgi:hypothetical protein
MADQRSLIEHVEFDDCEIQGPAVIAPAGPNVSFEASLFHDPPEVMFIPIAENRRVVGVVGLSDVRIYNCRLRNIAIIGPPEVGEMFKRLVE